MAGLAKPKNILDEPTIEKAKSYYREFLKRQTRHTLIELLVDNAIDHHLDDLIRVSDAKMLDNIIKNYPEIKT
jgi:hypothetical protein